MTITLSRQAAMDAMTGLGLSVAVPETPSLPDDILPTAILRELPADLRTGHWYCDLHHSMFLILLSRADEALASGHRSMAEYFLDTLVVYWIVHSLMEEEGLAQQIVNDLTCPDQAASHAAAHVSLTRWLWSQLIVPFKDGSLDNDGLRRVLQQFFTIVVNHISTVDQADYGHDSDLNERDVSRQIAHLAGCGLPLAPQMPGCGEMMLMLAPRMTGTLGLPTRNSLQFAPKLKRLQMQRLRNPLWTGGQGAFRDVLLQKLSAAAA